MELVHENDIEHLYFYGNGRVSGTFGRKGGPLIAPEFLWRVQDEKVVIFERPGAATIEELLIISQRGHLLTVRRKSGVVATYRMRQVGD